MKSNTTSEGFNALAGGSDAPMPRAGSGDNSRRRIQQLRAKLEERRSKLGLDPSVQAVVREKVRAGLTEQMALEVALTDHARDIYCQLDPHEAVELLLADLGPRLEPLRKLGTNHLGQLIPLPDAIEQELLDPLAAATMLAERIFWPILEETRAKAREEVKPLAGDDAQRIGRMVEDHWDVSRLREFLGYINWLGNNTLTRLELIVKFFSEFLAAPSADASTPAK